MSQSILTTTSHIPRYIQLLSHHFSKIRLHIITFVHLEIVKNVPLALNLLCPRSRFHVRILYFNKEVAFLHESRVGNAFGGFGWMCCCFRDWNCSKLLVRNAQNHCFIAWVECFMLFIRTFKIFWYLWLCWCLSCWPNLMLFKLTLYLFNNNFINTSIIHIFHNFFFVFYLFF